MRRSDRIERFERRRAAAGAQPPPVDDLRSRVAGEPVARLATLDRDGRPHLVPIVFALLDDTLYTAVDAKPKRSGTLRRIENARERPDVTVIVDRYEDDWTLLWWVRLRGRARVLEAATRPSRLSPRSRPSTSSTARARRGSPCSRSTSPTGALERDLGGVGGISLVVGVRWSFRDKDAESS